MTSKTALAAVVPVLAVALSACGSSGTDARGGSPPSPTSSSMTMAPGTSPSSAAAQPSTSSTTQPVEALITISDFAYTVPASVPTGARITIRNADSQAHTVTSKDGGFSVTVGPKGTATIAAPNEPGSYRVLCSFHADMSSTLVVR